MRAYGLALGAALVGCGEPAGEDTGEALDPTLTILLELAEVSSQDLLDGVVYTAEAQIGQDLDDLPDGSAYEGSLALPSAQAPAGLDAAVAVEWELLVESDSDMPTLIWVFQADMARLALPSADVAGAFEWGVVEKRWESRHLAHLWEGTLAIDGGEPFPLSFTAAYSGNLHSIEGTADGEPFAWTNDDPDQP